MPDNPELVDLVRKLARYLLDHPQACDTVDGISRWWLANIDGDEPGWTDLALDWLQLHDLAERLNAVDGRVRYRLKNPDDPATRDRLEALTHLPVDAELDAAFDEPAASDPGVGKLGLNGSRRLH
jgi:hypothetical protein